MEAGMEIPEGDRNRGAAGELQAFRVIGMDVYKHPNDSTKKGAVEALSHWPICCDLWFGNIEECMALAPLIRAGRDLTEVCRGGLGESL